MYDKITAHQIKWLRDKGVPLSAIINPTSLQYSENLGLHFPEQGAFWNPRTNEVMSPAWHMGELTSGTLSDPIVIHASVIEWLRSDRRGIFVVRWSDIFDNLYGFDAVSVHPDILPKYEHYMQPRMMPKVIEYGSI